MAFHHCVHGKSWLWLFLLGPAPFAFCFVSLLDGEAHIWLGDLRFALCGLCLCFVCAFELPSYMTTGVYVDVILNCFFSCKDRASERDRPYRRKKNLCLAVSLSSSFCLVVLLSSLWVRPFLPFPPLLPPPLVDSRGADSWFSGPPPLCLPLGIWLCTATPECLTGWHGFRLSAA